MIYIHIYIYIVTYRNIWLHAYYMFKNPSPPSPKIPKHVQTTHAGLTSRWVKAWFPVACCPTFAGPTSTESTASANNRHRHEAGQVTVVGPTG